jgi:RNA polymerase sigma factor (TIGR02999 family)
MLVRVSAGRPVIEKGSPQDVTELLQAWSAGNAAAGEKLMPLVYQELRRQAGRYLRRERRDHTLRPTALVHEAYLRLVGQRAVSWQNRNQFFALAAQMMRRALVDHARARARGKRGGSWCRVTLEEAGLANPTAPPDVDVLALEIALEELTAVDRQRARLVELRFFAGLSVEDAAEVLGVSASTVTRDWRVAKAWLFRRMHGGAAPAEGATP